MLSDDDDGDEDDSQGSFWKDTFINFWKEFYKSIVKGSAKPDVGEDGISGSVAVEISETGYDREEEEEKTRALIVGFFERQLGDLYKFGVEHDLESRQDYDEDDPDLWDCSEMGQHGYQYGGMTMPDGAQQQYDLCRPVTEPEPGDPLFLWSNKRQKIGHVMYYVGDGYVIHAVGGKVGKVVRDPLAKWEANPRFRGARRHPDFMRPKEDRPPAEDIEVPGLTEDS